MKRFIRRLLVIACVCCFVAQMGISCFAISKADTITNKRETVFSEYDYIVSLRRLNEIERNAIDIPMEEKQIIFSNAVEDELLSRKNLSDEILSKKYLYTKEQIAILREYNGGRLEEHAELAAITGTLTISEPIVMTATSNKIKVKVYWDWDHVPLVCNKDVFAVTWSPTFGSQNGNMRFKSSESNHTVWYAPGGPYESRTVSITQVEPNRAVKSEFYMELDEITWAKSGTFNLCLEAATGSAPLTEIGFYFAYGHTVIGLTPTVSFPAGFGITFGWNTSTADTLSGYVNVATHSWHTN